MKFEQQVRQEQAQKQAQKLVFTQQLTQSIQMLQFNIEELQSFLESKALENPLLEVEVIEDSWLSDHVNKRKQTDDQVNNFLNQIPDTPISLFEFLIEQIHLNYRDTYLRKLILFLAENVDSNGYLSISLEEAMKKTGAEYLQMLDALTLLQQLDPAGVGARNLRECLMLQTERDECSPPLAYLVLEEAFEELAERRWEEISKRYDLPLSQIQTIFDYIQTLHPYPGAIFSQSGEQYLIPDLVVQIEGDEIQLSSTKAGQPKLYFQQNYYERLTKIEDPEVKTYMQAKKGEYEWIKKSLAQRADTIIRVGKEIIRRQSDFFLNDHHPLESLTLKEIADALSLHESTISRAVKGKYLQAPFGIFELRSFFVHGIKNQQNQAITTNTIKACIQELIEKENKSKPLSDQKIVALLAERKINVSRRTVAKYRESLGILGSSKRKRYDTLKI